MSSHRKWLLRVMWYLALELLIYGGSLLSTLMAQPVLRDSEPQQQQSAPIGSQLQADISQLASAPRFTTAQYARAVAYITEQAKAVGLTTEIEPVKGVSPWERGDADLCEVLQDNAPAHPLSIVALANSAGGDIEAEVVAVNNFSDEKQGAPPHRFDEGGEPRIVFFTRPLQRDHSLAGYEEAVVQRNHGAAWAARYGAAAVLVRSVQTGNGPLHGGAVTYGKNKRIPAAALSVADADYLEHLLKENKSISLHLKIAPKHGSRKSNVNRQQSNVLVRIPGTTLAEETVLLGAHLDSHDITPGAADDAAGVAVVLAAMREFARNRPARTLLIVFFADEEVNYSGGKEFAKRHGRNDLSTR